MASWCTPVLALWVANSSRLASASITCSQLSWPLRLMTLTPLDSYALICCFGGLITLLSNIYVVCLHIAGDGEPQPRWHHGFVHFRAQNRLHKSVLFAYILNVPRALFLEPFLLPFGSAVRFGIYSWSRFWVRNRFPKWGPFWAAPWVGLLKTI